MPAKKNSPELKLLHEAEAIVETYQSIATPQGKSRLDDINFCIVGYAEPGYSSDKKVIALGNWNSITKWDEEKHTSVEVDDTPSLVGDLLDKIGVNIEWSDEWICCNGCGKVVRIKSDSSSWRQSYAYIHEADFCLECVTKTKQSRLAYVETLEGQHNRCMTIDIDLEKLGYKPLGIDFANGWYGQSDDPKNIADSLRKMNITRFVFVLDSQNPFEVGFSLFVHKSEVKLFKEEEFAPSPGTDVAKQFQKAVKQLPPVTNAPAGSVVVNRVNLDDGSVETKTLTAQQFIEHGIS